MEEPERSVSVRSREASELVSGCDIGQHLLDAPDGSLNELIERSQEISNNI
ncbi:MAG: hypothetical protein J2P54_09385 [Bradyrhizobiaceae bacterium]|nr:hypothetical protein [Bradyrhizobiaceae bacterium]